MDQERRLTKKELKILRKLEKLESQTAQSKQNTVKWIVISVASVLFILFFGMLVFFAKQSSQTGQTAQLSSAGQVRGTESAQLTLVEFGDFQCPSCKAAEPMIAQALQEYDGKLKLLFKHFPLKSIHPNAMLAAKVSEAAGKQGKFWEMHDLLYEKQDEWAESANPLDMMSTYAENLELDVEQLKKDITLKEIEDKINAQEDEGIKNGVNGTPSFFLNSKKLENIFSDYNALKPLIEAELKKVNTP